MYDRIEPVLPLGTLYRLIFKSYFILWFCGLNAVIIERDFIDLFRRVGGLIWINDALNFTLHLIKVN